MFGTVEEVGACRFVSIALFMQEHVIFNGTIWNGDIFWHTLVILRGTSENV